MKLVATGVFLTLLSACGAINFFTGSDASPRSPRLSAVLAIDSPAARCICNDRISTDCPFVIRAKLEAASGYDIRQLEGSRVSATVGSPGSAWSVQVSSTVQQGQIVIPWRSWPATTVNNWANTDPVHSLSFAIDVSQVGEYHLASVPLRLLLEAPVPETSPTRLRCVRWGNAVGTAYQMAPSRRPASIVATFYSPITADYEVVFELRESDFIDPDDIISKGTNFTLGADQRQAYYNVIPTGGYDPLSPGGGDNCVYFGRVWLAKDPDHLLASEVDNYQTVNDELVDHFAKLIDYGETGYWSSGCGP